MKKTIKSLVFGTEKASDYVAIGVPAQLSEPIYLLVDNQRFRVQAHCLVYEPVMAGVVVEKSKVQGLQLDAGVLLEFMDSEEKRVLGSMVLSLDAVTEFEHHNFMLFHVVSANYGLSSPRLRLLNEFLYQKSKAQKNSFLTAYNRTIYKNLSTFFVHPRLAYMVTIYDENNQEMYFPIDLHVEVEDTVFWSVRNSNRSTSLLKVNDRCCISDVKFEHRSTAYKLGKFTNHDSNHAEFIRTASLKMKIAEIFLSYTELEIKSVNTMESQTIFEANILNSVKDKQATNPFLMAHIQRLRMMDSAMQFDHKFS